ncbi:hypothetical protein AB0N16_29625 [Streptomyces sp. NPDC051105]|uniref:hypothetical protein n=1 Tax=Streptomyces sp. NPDC051105 TaxID=3154843 RepID=UPI00343C2C80
MDEGLPTSPEAPGDAVLAAGKRAEEMTPAAPSGTPGEEPEKAQRVREAPEADAEADLALVPPDPAADRPQGPQRPRHVPDPCSTPPYGRPGPWAPVLGSSDRN